MQRQWQRERVQSEIDFGEKERRRRKLIGFDNQRQRWAIEHLKRKSLVGEGQDGIWGELNTQRIRESAR